MFTKKAWEYKSMLPCAHLPSMEHKLKTWLRAVWASLDQIPESNGIGSVCVRANLFKRVTLTYSPLQGEWSDHNFLNPVSMCVFKPYIKIYQTKRIQNPYWMQGGSNTSTFPSRPREVPVASGARFFKTAWWRNNETGESAESHLALSQPPLDKWKEVHNTRVGDQRIDQVLWIGNGWIEHIFFKHAAGDDLKNRYATKDVNFHTTP